ncbi:hypothetical protein RRG08_058460 [Elysia crispata]|uniref:Uncharacterized protein n=1 Tax=Elysia crispata TaxID=231223 RepID=A0AAE0Y673_9GAST|nr:hypothetical protein RRG08_058460 [Elysia crispata]
MVNENWVKSSVCVDSVEGAAAGEFLLGLQRFPIIDSVIGMGLELGLFILDVFGNRKSVIIAS